MAVLTALDELEATACPRQTAPVLHVRCDGEPRDRTVTLSTGKCTVGSSPQCQVHLPSADVRPLQCLIMLEANAASVTRWASGVQLNGRDFSKASLEDGDRLTIGGWEIEFDGGGYSRPRPKNAKEARPAAPAVTAEIQSSPRVETKIPQRAAPLVVAPPATRPTALIEPGASFDESGSEQPIATSSVHTFQDRLVLALWTANYQARRRAKGLINGIRAARFQADAMAADLSAMETELDLARAAYDSHIGHDDRLELELADFRRQEELRIASLTDEIAALRSQLELAQAALAQRTAEYDKLASEAASVRPMAANADTLDVPQAQVVPLDEVLAAESAVAPPSTTASPVVAQEPSEDVWQVVQPVSDPEPKTEQPPISWDSFAPIAEEVAPTAAAAIPELTPASAIQVEPAAQTPLSVFEPPPIELAPAPAGSTMAAAPHSPAEEPAAPAWAAPQEEPARQHSSTSFIDKYRHLLEEEDSTSAALPSAGCQPVIEEEFLSPAKAQTCASPADESDEALEAYMANMMRRVRSSSTSFASDQAPSRVLEPPASSLSHFLQSSSPSAEPAPSPSVAELLSAEPISFEDLKLATRKVPLASDLAALRELANSTARTAIKTHVQRRSRESAITKLIVALTAMVSAAYLMASAPALDNLQFWTGAATCAVGIAAAIQVLVLERRRQR